MNENKINQILRNQIDIMFAAGINSGRIKSMEKLKKRMVETKKLLYPKQETPLAEQMEDVMSEETEKKGWSRSYRISESNVKQGNDAE